MPSTGRAPAPARRLPVQERSALRVDLMLDAAGELLVEGGYAAATTSAVAARAGVSIGSLYQFFPDRDAVLQALARRSFERFTVLLADRLRTGSVRSWQAMLDLVVDTYVEFSLSEPSGRALSFGGAFDRQMLQPESDNNVVVAHALGELLVDIRPDLVLDDALLTALRVAVEAADAVLQLAMTRANRVDPLLVEQAKLLLRVYLAQHIPAAAPRRPRRDASAG